MATKKRAVRDHVDNLWISEKIGGHGGSYCYSSVNGLVRIGYIGVKPKVVIWWYNLQLLYRYIKRRIKGAV